MSRVCSPYEPCAELYMIKLLGKRRALICGHHEIQPLRLYFDGLLKAQDSSFAIKLSFQLGFFFSVRRREGDGRIRRIVCALNKRTVFLVWTCTIHCSSSSLHTRLLAFIFPRFYTEARRQFLARLNEPHRWEIGRIG